MNIKRLLKLLEERNITRYRLSKLSGVNESTITRLINEKNKDPKLSTVKAIAKALDVDVNEIIWFLISKGVI